MKCSSDSWSNKPDKISRRILTLDYKIGGIKMVDLEIFITALKVIWLRRVYRNNSPWVAIFQSLIVKDTAKLKKTPGSVFAIKQTDCMRNTFWIAVLEAWDKLFSKRILTTNKFLNICKINDNLCYVCNLFWLCPVTNNFLKEVTVVLKPYIDLSGLLCTTTVLLGIRSKENSRILNHLINLIKNYIYLIKCVGQILSISGVIEKIRSTYKVEKNIVIQFQKNKEVMESKWNLLIPLLDY